tara:strand:+ start:56 stop:226 length:171 start_codon:yes stop_codon:yes gene_type:complete
MAMDRVAQLSKFRSVAGEGHFFEETINIKKIKTLLDNRMEGQVRCVSIFVCARPSR